VQSEISHADDRKQRIANLIAQIRHEGRLVVACARYIECSDCQLMFWVCFGVDTAVRNSEMMIMYKYSTYGGESNVLAWIACTAVHR